MQKRHKHTKFISVVIGSLALLNAHITIAGSPTVTTFNPDTAIQSTSMNTNFANVKSAVDDNNSRLTTIEDSTITFADVGIVNVDCATESLKAANLYSPAKVNVVVIIC